MMKIRMSPYRSSGPLMAALVKLEAEISGSGIERPLVHLVKTRASQINGCAYCISMHTTEALSDGESAQRLFLLDAWRESPLYTDRERAALRWTEAVTLVSETHVPDSVYDEARRHFDEAELVRLTLLIGIINTWNRVGISFRAVHPVMDEKSAA